MTHLSKLLYWIITNKLRKSKTLNKANKNAMYFVKKDVEKNSLIILPERIRKEL